MFKKSRGKQRIGIGQTGVRKHKIRVKLDTQNTTTKGLLKGQKLSQWTEHVWRYLSNTCSKLNLVPFTVNSDGMWTFNSSNWLIMHYALVAFTLGIVARNLLLSINCLATDGLNLMSVLSLSFFMLSLVAGSGAIGSSWTPTEMMDLLNSWRPNLNCIQDETGIRYTYFGKTSENLKILGVTWIFHMLAMEFTLASIIFKDIPTTCFGFLRSYIPAFTTAYDADGSSFYITPLPLLRILLSPVELVIILGPAIVAAFNIVTGIMSLTLIRIYCDEMRKIYIRDFHSWRKVEKIYAYTRLYNIMYMNWLQYVLGPVIFSIGAGIVILLFVSARPFGLPPVIHYWVPILAVLTTLNLSWLWYDVIMIKRSGDEVLGNLQSTSHSFLWQQLEPAKRNYVLRRGRALRPVYITIGRFSDMTFEGLIGVWDEILNQFLFLLSL